VEILLSAGLEDAVRRKSEEQYPPDGGINNVESLAGREIANYFPNLNSGVDEFSPTVRLFINQDALEPILRARAAELGARLRYRTECTSLSQDADGVTAVVRDLESGTESSVRAKYVVAADGNRSPVRERLGIGVHGHGLLSHSITIYFRALADLGSLLKVRNQGVHYVTNPLMRVFFRLDRGGNAGFLVVNLVGDTSRPEAIAAFPAAPWANVAEGITEQRALELLRAAIGVPDIDVVIDNIATWRAEANCAERFGDGRVFLAGDAAHVVPPNGRPGARAPHVFLDRDGTRLSTLDLFGRNFVLLAGPGGAAWPAAAPIVAGRLGGGPRRARGGGSRADRPGGPLPRGVRDLAVRSRAGAAGRLRGLAGCRSGQRTRAGSPASAPDAAVPRRRPAMNSESGRRKKVHSWHTCIARTPWDRSCARST